MKKIVCILFVLVFTQTLCAQDIIYKKNNQTISCKITEIGLIEVKYVIPEKYKDVVLAIAKDDILKIVYENGEVQTFVNEMYDKNSYADNKLNAIKIHPFSPLYGCLTFSYERSVKAGQSYEGTLGIIGIGFDIFDAEPAGAYAKFGYKFIKNPDFYLRGMRYAHLLKGTYFKPEIALSAASFKRSRYFDTDQIGSNTKGSSFNGALLFNFGKQWVFNNRFAVDFSIGLGYGLTSVTENDYSDVFYQYGFTVDPITGFAYTSNFKIAYLF